MKLTRSWWRRKSDDLSCREVGRVMQAYLDDELDPGDAPAVEEHLAACRRCGLEGDVYREVKSSLGHLGRHDGAEPEAITRLREFAESLADESD